MCTHCVCVFACMLECLLCILNLRMFMCLERVSVEIRRGVMARSTVGEVMGRCGAWGGVWGGVWGAVLGGGGSNHRDWPAESHVRGRRRVKDRSCVWRGSQGGSQRHQCNGYTQCAVTGEIPTLTLLNTNTTGPSARPTTAPITISALTPPNIDTATLLPLTLRGIYHGTGYR